MQNFRGYILENEIVRKLGKYNSFFTVNNIGKRKHMGSTSCLKADSLPEKYQEIVKECQDLEFYRTFAYFCDQVGVDKSYLNVAIAQKNGKEEFEHKKLGFNRVIKISEEYNENIKKGLTAYLINKKTKLDKDDTEYYKKIITMNDMTIAFY